VVGESGGRSWRSWGECGSCGFQGIMTFRARSGEDYSDPEALAVMMDSECPACGAEESVLVAAEEFGEMERDRRGQQR